METPQRAAERRLLGVGLSFPLRKNASGYAAISSGRERVGEAIEQLVMTDPYERPHRVRAGVTYGTRVRRMLFEDFETAAAVSKSDIRTAIQIWEPRAELIDITVTELSVGDTSGGEGLGLAIRINYRVRATGVEDFRVINVQKEGNPYR